MLSDLPPLDLLPPPERLRRGNRTGFVGVSKAGKRYRATGTVGGRQVSLGMFDDVLDAGVAACDFRIQHARELWDERKVRGRGRVIERCKHGHPMEGDNLRIGSNGRRTCRTCQREWTRRKRAQ